VNKITIFQQDDHREHQGETAAPTFTKYIINKNETTPTSLTPIHPAGFLARTKPTSKPL
jgi:hypothetical protein